MKKKGRGSEGEEAKERIKISKKSQTLSVAIAAVIVSSIMIAFVPLASAGVTSFTISPADGTAGEIAAYSAVVNTTGFSKLNITIPAGFGAQAPTVGEQEIIKADLYDINGEWCANITITSNSQNVSTEVDVTGYNKSHVKGDILILPVNYSAGGETVIKSPLTADHPDVLNLTLPTSEKKGYLNISLPASITLTKVSISIGEFVKNPTKADDYVFIAEELSETVYIEAPPPTPTPTVYRRGGRGAAVPKDSDGDGYSDIDEMLAGIDPYDATSYLGAPVVTPTPTPTPSPTPTMSPTPTLSPTPSPTPKPWIPGFEAVFTIAGLLAAVIYLVLRRKK